MTLSEVAAMAGASVLLNRPPEADGYKYVDMGGQGKCFSEGTWQLRKVYVLEAVPVNPNHP